MKQKLLLLLAAICLLSACLFPVYAASPCIEDEAELLTDEERTQLERKLNEISLRYGVDVVIVTVYSTADSTPMEYADDYYDYHDYRADGVLLLVSVESSDWWISTAGYGIQAFTDAGIDYIADQVVPLLSDGNYAAAFETFAELCESFLGQAETGDPYDTHNLPKKPFRLVLNLAIALIAGLIAAFLVTGSMKKKLQSVSRQGKADNYVTPGSFQLTQSRDFHLYTHLDRTEKTQSSGGSSTHTSSSGTTHGGGGGKF